METKQELLLHLLPGVDLLVISYIPTCYECKTTLEIVSICALCKHTYCSTCHGVRYKKNVVKLYELARCKNCRPRGVVVGGTWPAKHCIACKKTGKQCRTHCLECRKNPIRSCLLHCSHCDKVTGKCMFHYPTRDDVKMLSSMQLFNGLMMPPFLNNIFLLPGQW